RITARCSRLSACARDETRKPGVNSSVRAPPPIPLAASRTTTLRPARASVTAATSPLCPPPMTIAAKDVMGVAHVAGRLLQVAQDLRGGVAAGRSHHATARMRGRAADVEPPDRRAVLRVAGHRPVEQQLVEGEFALEDVALCEADL